MSQFQDEKIEKARKLTPLGSPSKFYATVEDGDLVGIIFGAKDLVGQVRPYFYEIYDEKKFLGCGGGLNHTDPELLTDMLKERLKAIHKTRAIK